MKRSHRHLARHRARGGAYIMVLATAMTVTVLGLSALMLARVQTRLTTVRRDEANARSYAQSMVQLALQRLSTDNNWRTNYIHDKWTTNETIGKATCRYKIVDTANSSLATAPDDLRLYVQATVGSATRLYSVGLSILTDLGPGNVLVNGNMESGLTAWSANGTATLESRTDSPHGGTAYIKVKNRSAASAGVLQDVTTKISSGNSYDFQMWVRMKDSTDNIRAVLRVKSILLITQDFPLTSWTSIDNNYVMISGSATPTWINLLSSAYIYVETQNDKKDFYIDDAAFARSGYTFLQGVPMTWRQEVLP